MFFLFLVYSYKMPMILISDACQLIPPSERVVEHTGAPCGPLRGPVRPQCVPRTAVRCHKPAAAPSTPSWGPHGGSWHVRLLDLQCWAHRGQEHGEIKRRRFLTNKTCAESTFDLPIAVYMTILRIAWGLFSEEENQSKFHRKSEWLYSCREERETHTRESHIVL